ncbi:phosphoribosyltransferase [Reinekea sp.]|jgi:hypoxanthine phosphoribosyltransferase|uniref:phosphoribosyltransferase n=1 Tax=Reinekea sp. TaxID=1970455 RepID=UPI002A82C34C|nr:phosphoribosyltransferase family protein [Reinekea sp.]
MKKRYLDEDTLIEDSFRLGVQIFESGFRPSFIVGLWRGGSAVGIYVQECLQTLGVDTDHISIRTSYTGLPAYQSMVDQPSAIRIHGTQYLIDHLNADDRLLIVDDVFSTGHSIEATLARLRTQLKLNMPEQVRVATLFQRSDFQRTDFRPDYCLHQTSDWLVFPYELKGLTPAEIMAHKPYVSDLIHPERIKPRTTDTE